MAPKQMVKEEPEEPEPDTEPVEVSAGTVLHNLEDLLERGKALLRFTRPAGVAGWGINGKVEAHWCSFRAEAGGVCHFVDGEAWCTEGSDEWADDELEWLQRLQKQAEGCPATNASQPSAFKPRACRKAVFTYHKAEHRKKRLAEAAAKAGAAKPAGSAAVEAQPAVEPAAAKAPVAKAPVAKGKAPVAKVVAKPPAVAAKVVAKSPVVVAKTVAKPPVAKAVAPKAMAKIADPKAVLPQTPPPAEEAAAEDGTNGVAGATFSKFLFTVKARCTPEGQTEPDARYREILQALIKDEDDEVIRLLADHVDLHAWFQDLASSTAARRAEATAARLKAQGPPEPTEVPVVDVEEVLRPLREFTEDLPTRLVKLVLGNREALPTLRLAMLRYLRSEPGADEAYKQMFIVRGPCGIGKTTYSLGQIVAEVAMPTLEEERRAAQYAHLCSTHDFFTRCQGSANEEFAPELDKIELARALDKIEMAQAQNQARVKLATEVGIHPIYVDDSHLHLWEMQPYVSLGKAAGYDVSIVEPSRIWQSWNTLEELAKRNAGREHPSSKLSQEELQVLLDAFEALPAVGDPLQKVLAAERGTRRFVGLPGAVPAILKAKRPAPDAAPGGDGPPAAKVAKAA